MYTIVVADDEEELRKAILRKIDWEAIGFQVVGEAENGVEALEMVEKMEPDLLLTDIRMPFISGIELARQVREIRPATQIVFLSGFDDFSYAQQAIQYNIISYLLKPISMAELTEELIKIKQKVDKIFEEFTSRKQTADDMQSFVMPLLLDDIQAEYSNEREQELLDQAVGYGILKKGNELRYGVITTVVRNHSGDNVTSPEHVYAINTILQKYVKFSSFYSEKKVVSLILATEGAFDKYMHILVGDIVQSMERILDLNCAIGVSRVVDRLVYLHEAYREAIGAMSYAKKETSGVHYIADEEPASVLNLEKVQTMVVEVENLIRGGSRQELSELLENIFSQIESKAVNRIQMDFLLVQILSSVCRILYGVSEEGDTLELAEDSFFKRMHLFDGSISATESRITGFCLEARDAVAEKRKKSSEVLTDKTIQIIDTRYSDPDISLISISSEIGVSPNYLSAMMKKHTGQTFVDLLTRKRVEEAKKLLVTTTMKIREISERCGYNDQHYFSYSFKKYIGISPGAMRQEMAEAALKETGGVDAT